MRSGHCPPTEPLVARAWLSRLWRDQRRLKAVGKQIALLLDVWAQHRHLHLHRQKVPGLGRLESRVVAKSQTVRHASRNQIDAGSRHIAMGSLMFAHAFLLFQGLYEAPMRERNRREVILYALSCVWHLAKLTRPVELQEGICTLPYVLLQHCAT